MGEIPRSAQTAAIRSGSGSRGAGLPAVAQLLLLVDQRQALALVGLGLDPADLLRARLMVEQQDDQALDRRQVFVSRCAGERRARVGGEQPPLPVVDHGSRLAGVGSVADARDELAGAHQHPGESLDSLAGDLAARVRRELERVEFDLLDPAVNGCPRHGRDVEQGRTWEQSGVGRLHLVASLLLRGCSVAV